MGQGYYQQCQYLDTSEKSYEFETENSLNYKKNIRNRSDFEPKKNKPVE